MKYFREELRQLDNEAAYREWEKVLDQYWTGFGTYQKRLPAKFVKEYTKHAFHDYEVGSLHLQPKSYRKNINVSLSLCYDEATFHLSYIGVRKCNVKFNIGLHCITLLYNEILPISGDYLSHEIDFTDGNKMYIEFKKVRHSSGNSTPSSSHSC